MIVLLFLSINSKNDIGRFIVRMQWVDCNTNLALHFEYHHVFLFPISYWSLII